MHPGQTDRRVRPSGPARTRPRPSRPHAPDPHARTTWSARGTLQQTASTPSVQFPLLFSSRGTAVARAAPPLRREKTAPIAPPRKPPPLALHFCRCSPTPYSPTPPRSPFAASRAAVFRSPFAALRISGPRVRASPC